MKLIKNLFSGTIAIVFFVIIIFISAIFLILGIKIADLIYPYLVRLNTITFYVSLLILLPLALFKKTRSISSIGLFIASFVFGACLWVTSFLVTYFYWGIFGVVLGIFIAGVGVVPFGLIASLLNGNWGSFGDIIFSLILTFGARALSLYFAKKIDEEEARKNLYSEPIQNENFVEGVEINQSVSSIYATPTYLADDRDEIYPEVKEFILNKKEIMVSDLQKNFAIGYSRGARIMDHLRQDGLIGDAEGGGKARIVLSNDLQGKKIVECLKAFGIQTKISEIIHQKGGIEFCLDVALGSPMEEIVKRERDIAAIVESPTGKVKIQAPIPGKSQVGIFVPTEKKK